MAPGPWTAFGEVMDDELAAAAIQADDLLTQWHSEALDISMPVRLRAAIALAVCVSVCHAAVWMRPSAANRPP